MLALERTRIEAGVSRRGTAAEERLTGVKLPTVLNQSEAAMAYARELPLLVLVENGLKAEGILEPLYDWRVKHVDLGKPVVDDPDFVGIFEDWRNTVLARRDAIVSEP